MEPESPKKARNAGSFGESENKRKKLDFSTPDGSENLEGPGPIPKGGGDELKSNEKAGGTTLPSGAKKKEDISQISKPSVKRKATKTDKLLLQEAERFHKRNKVGLPPSPLSGPVAKKPGVAPPVAEQEKIPEKIEEKERGEKEKEKQQKQKEKQQKEKENKGPRHVCPFCNQEMKGKYAARRSHLMSHRRAQSLDSFKAGLLGANYELCGWETPDGGICHMIRARGYDFSKCKHQQSARNSCPPRHHYGPRENFTIPYEEMANGALFSTPIEILKDCRPNFREIGKETLRKVSDGLKSGPEGASEAMKLWYAFPRMMLAPNSKGRLSQWRMEENMRLVEHGQFQKAWKRVTDAPSRLLRGVDDANREKAAEDSRDNPMEIITNNSNARANFTRSIQEPFPGPGGGRPPKV